MNGAGKGSDREHARHLMMAALDGEIDPAQQAELDRILETDDDLRREWNRLTRVKEVTDTMTYRKPPEEVWGIYWASVYNRFERGIGWLLVSIGATVLLTFGVWQFIQELMADSSIPIFIKLAILLVIAGGALLLVSVLREKLFTRSRDPYKEVQR